MKIYIRGGIGDFLQCLPFVLMQPKNEYFIHTHFKKAEQFFKDFGMISFPADNTGVQMGGWFRKEVRTVADLKGLKMRIAGLGGEVMARLGAVPQHV